MRNLALKNLLKKGLKAENLIEVLPYLGLPEKAYKAHE